MVRKLKHTDIGDIPVDWELQTFDETFRVLSNNTLSRENLNNRGGAVRNIHYGDILTKFPEVLNCKEEIPYVNELSLLSSSTQLLQDGDIVIADTAEDETVGKVTEVQNLGDSKLVAGLHTIPCRVKKGDFAPGWLGYYMNSNLFHNQILPYITGIKVSSISKGAISETLILVPPFDEQEKIVQSLNEVQLLMTAETKVVNKMKFVKNGCLSKMFPQKDATVPEMRLPGFTEAWEQRKLGEICSRVQGNDGRMELPTLTISAANGWMKQEDRFSGNIAGKEQKNYTLLHKGELSYNHGNSKLAKYGTVFSLQTYEEALVPRVYHSFKVEIGSADFIEYYFATKMPDRELRKLISSGARMDGLLNIGYDDFMGIKMMFPSVLEQDKIAEYFRAFDHLITLHQRKCDTLKELKKYMLQNMFPKKG